MSLYLGQSPQLHWGSPLSQVLTSASTPPTQGFPFSRCMQWRHFPSSHTPMLLLNHAARSLLVEHHLIFYPAPTLSQGKQENILFRSRAGISAGNSYPPPLQELNEAVKRTGAFVLAKKDVQYLLPQLQIFPPLTLCQSAAHCELNPRYRSPISSAPSASECHYSLRESSPSPQSQPPVAYLHLPHTSPLHFLGIRTHHHHHHHHQP